MKLFDSHAHLDDSKFDEDREQVIQTCLKENNSKFVTIGYSLKSSKEAIELAKKYNLYATVGISPNDIPQTEEELLKELEQIEQLIKKEISTNTLSNDLEQNLREQNEKEQSTKKQYLLAIGEIGLDYYWNKENKELQKQAFIKQIEMANKYNLPITIHTREAVNDTLEILKTNNVNNKGIFHCCPHNRELVKEALKLGFYISFAGPVTFKNAKNADEIIQMVPDDKMLIETDSPYLSPEPERGKRNNPTKVKYIAQKIAQVKNLTLEEVANKTLENAKQIYKIKE